MTRHRRPIALASLLLLLCCGCAETPPATVPTTRPATEPAATRPTGRLLFDGKTLEGWKTPQWGGSGEVKVVDGAMHILPGDMCSGATYTGEIPRDNYEITLQAMRVARNDFFCGLTFPVGPDNCSLILGGWGGTTVGLSSLDEEDASLNETSQEMVFENGRWYDVRLRVTDEHIRAWLDGERIIDVARAGRKISIRPEVDLSRPLGIATWQTHGAIRDIRLRKLEE